MSSSKNNRSTEVTIETGSVQNSTIIGVKQGPSLDEVREAVHEELAELRNLLSYNPHSIPQIKSRDPVAEALFACESETVSTLGFAVNNSGLLICPSIGPISTVRQLISGAVCDAEMIQTRNLLQAVRVKRTTSGLIPSYTWHEVSPGEELFVFNQGGKRCTLLVVGLMMWVHINRRHPLPPIVIKDAFIGSLSPPQKLIGGPVINGANEVVGIAVAAFEGLGEVIIKPWSTLEHCIEMQVEEGKS
jgi:hypothetical protein